MEKMGFEHELSRSRMCVLTTRLFESLVLVYVEFETLLYLVSLLRHVQLL